MEAAFRERVNAMGKCTLQVAWLCMFVVILEPSRGHPFVCLDTVSVCVCDPTKLSVNCSARGFRALPRAALPNVTSSLSFGGNHLTAVLRDTFADLGSLLSLSVENNQIAFVEPGSFDRSRKLRYLDLSGNKLSVVPPALSVLTLLTVLNLSGNALSSVSTEDFKNFSRLATLNLAHNSLHSIPESAFHTLANLELLYLDHNFISADPIGWFANSTRLAQLRMSDNLLPLSAGVEDWFGVAWQILPLEALALDNNAIREISEATFRGCANLRELQLGGNGIETVAPLSFADFTKLEALSLDGNRLSRVPADLFLYAENLRSLSLAGNALTVLSWDAFEGLEQTVSLNLAGNRLTGIVPSSASAAHTTHYLPAITHLYLNSNLLTDVPDVRSLASLEVLDLSGNAITALEPYAFNGTSLRRLYVHDNRLTTMAADNFRELPALEAVTITGNPWVCDCRLFWVRDPAGEASAWRVALYADVFCQAPDFAKDLHLHRLYGPFAPCETADWPSIVVIVAAWVLVVALALGCYLSRMMSYERGYVGRRMKVKAVRKVPVPAAPAPAGPAAPSSAARLNKGATFEDLDRSSTTGTTYVLTSGARGHEDDGIEMLEEVIQLPIREQPKRRHSVDNADLPVTGTSTV